MRENFWIKTWERSNIGFHRSDIHPALARYWPGQQAGTVVLVPLCGKSLDLLWLEAQGLDVMGVEFIESAVVDFFHENKLAFEEDVKYGHRCYRATERNICIFITDFIQLADDYTGPAIKTLYDRAALVALPEDMRAAYVKACRKLLCSRPQGLLVTLTYTPEVMEGPPFSVPPDEVERLWEGRIRRVEQVGMLSEMPRAVASGVRELDEYYWLFR